MALINCKECTKQVSDSAKTCPNCGAPVPVPQTSNWLAIFIAGSFGLIVFSMIYYASRAKPPAPVTPQEAAANTAKKLVDAAKFKELQVVIMGAKLLKNSMKNPDAFKLTGAMKMADGTICYEYRSTNSFNAIVPGYYTLTPKKGSTLDADWLKYCAGKSGTDFSHARYAL